MINSNQTIIDWADCIDKHQKWTESAIEDYMALKDDVREIIDIINNGSMSPIVGTGNPNGVIVSNYSLKYIDSSIPAEYYNPAFGVNTGWIAL